MPVHGLMQFDGSWVNFDGQTPFIRAALSGDIEVMRLLLAARRRPEYRDRSGDHGADGGRRDQLDSGADLHAIARPTTSRR